MIHKKRRCHELLFKTEAEIRQILVVGTMCPLAGFVTGALAVAKKQMVVMPFQDAKFVPVDPTRPDGPQMAVLWGDRAKGPSSLKEAYDAA